MKTFILSLICTAIVVLSFAQQNSWYAGGNVRFNVSKTKVEINGNEQDGGQYTTWSFSPEFGTFLTNSLQLGIGVTLQGNKSESGDGKSVQKSTLTGATLYVRNFFSAGAFRPFVGMNVSALPGTTDQTSGNIKTESSIFDFGINLNAGFGYSLSEKVTAVGSFGLLGFNSITQKNKDTDNKFTTNNFGIDVGTLGDRFSIGIYFTL